MSVNEKMTAIADEIRKYTTETDRLSLDEMPTKISRVHDIGFENGVAKGESDGYQTGYTEGETAGVAKGKEAERKNFWNCYQNHGARTLWQYAFYDWLWQDANYNPIYDIEATNVDNMYISSYITDTKVSIDISGVGNAYYMFYNCIYLKTIRKLIVSDSVAFGSTFYNCKALQSITIEGVIGNSFNIRWSPLTKESITSIINALSSTTTGKTLTLKKSAVETAFERIYAASYTWDVEFDADWEAIVWTYGIGDGVEVGEYVYISYTNTDIVIQKTSVQFNPEGDADEGRWVLIAQGKDLKDEWGDLVASKPNWTISLV